MPFFIGTLAAFFALNMGGANFASSFAPAYGGQSISRRSAGILFTVFVMLGAVGGGHHVSQTLAHRLVPSGVLTPAAVLIILSAAGFCMFLANLLDIPQSTSLVTVAAIAGVGLQRGGLDGATILWMGPFWIGLPVVSFLLTYLLAGFVYPPRKINFWVYEKLVNHKRRLAMFVLLTGCYNAFSVGTNNVANVAGPLAGCGLIGEIQALAWGALFFGAGAYVFSGPLKTVGKRIVPLGLLTASIISLVSGSLMIFASAMGIPQSFVMLQVGSLLAVAVLKHGKEPTFSDPMARRTLLAWIWNPLLALGTSYALAAGFYR